ncbi:MAG: sporulation protein YqfD [Bacillota bacterium]
MKRAREYFKGYVVVEVRGKNPERLINLCLANGFPLWDFAVQENQATFSTTVSKYKEIRPLARRAHCVPRVRKRVGLPFLAQRVRRRPAIVWAMVFIIGMFVYLSGSVWSVEVKGTEKIATETILEAARKGGLTTGVRRKDIPPDIDAVIIREVPQLSWAYVHCQGTRAIIEVAEKSRPASEGPGDVVAVKDGVIESVLVHSGVPVVRPGDTVQKGSLLIAGETSGEIKGARGTVTALTFYEVRLEIPFQQLVAYRSGRKSEARLVRYSAAQGDEDTDSPGNGNEWILAGSRNMFEWYEIEDYPDQDLVLPGGRRIQLVTRVFYELQWKEVTVEADEARTLALRQARATIERRLPSSAKLIDLTCEELPWDGQGLSIRVTASAIEEIGQVRQWSEQNTEVDR